MNRRHVDYCRLGDDCRYCESLAEARAEAADEPLSEAEEHHLDNAYERSLGL